MTAATVDPGDVREKSRFEWFSDHWLIKIVIITIAVFWLIPSLGLLVTSFRPALDIASSGWWTVFSNLGSNEWTVANYQRVIEADGMGNAFLNSLAVSIPATIIPIAIAAFAAYAFAWMEFRGRQFLFVVVVGLMVVPLQMALIPLLQIYVNFDLSGTYLAVWLAHTGFGLPLAIYLLRNYIGSLPKSIIESAAIDGASHFQTFFRLVVPLSVPVIASFAIFQFLWVWNDFLVAIVFLGGTPDVAVVTIRLAELVGSRGQDWHVLTAGAFLTMVLPLIVFFSLQRFFVRGLTAGSVKG
ncbi:MAG: carbohydrate ABC transporter permease [Actinobacteria bacterium]|nr:carbohydrate ABC transporter permease [Actinomycetota bacterium]